MTTSIKKAIVGYDNRRKKGLYLVQKINGKRTPIYMNWDGWYFYILKEDFNKIEDIIFKFKDQGLIYYSIKGQKYVRVYANRQVTEEPTIETLRVELEERDVQVFEFDLNKTKRYMIDNQIGIETDLDVLYFDIETDDSTGQISIGRDKILSWAACDIKGNVYFEIGKEKEILQKFVKLIDSYDIITGWNSEQFDLPYIQARCEKYGIEYDWRNIIHLDMMQRCFKIYSYEMASIGLKNFSLNEVARVFLDRTKVDHTGFKIHELFKKDQEKLKEYNINDAMLLKELDTKLGIIGLMIQECNWTGSFLNKFYIGELLDNYILREAKKQHIILESKPSEKTKNDRNNINIVGGYVMEPKVGLYHDVSVCDFKGLYPSIIVGWNIGLDTLDRDLNRQGREALEVILEGRKIEELPYSEWNEFLVKEKARLDPNNLYFQTASNSFFKRGSQSFIGSLVKQLLAQRVEYKKKLKVLEFDTPEYNNTYAAERVVKEMANSMFGITCDKNSRYFDKDVSEGITFTGQYLNKLSAYISLKLGFDPIYGDTDSLFITKCEEMDNSIEVINHELKTQLDVQFKLKNNIVRLDYEKKFKKFILLEKKRYTGILCIKDGKKVDKIFSRGTEDVRKSNIKLAKKYFTELSKLLFDSEFKEKDAIEYIKKLRKHIQHDIIDPENLLISIKISKEIEHYKVLGIGARLAKRLIAEEKIAPIVESEKKVGTRLEYILVRRQNKNEGVLLEEFDGNWDRDHYWMIQIYAPLKRLLRCVFPTVDWDDYNELEYQSSLFA